MNIQKIFFILLLSITPHISAMFYYDFHLRSAAARNDTKTVIACINQGINVNAQDEDTGNTALHEAAFKGNVETTKILLEHGAQVDIINRDKRRPLHMAINSHQKNRTCATMLLKVESTDHANQLCKRLEELERDRFNYV
jgi:ankyrin repeat protein